MIEVEQKTMIIYNLCWTDKQTCRNKQYGQTESIVCFWGCFFDNCQFSGLPGLKIVWRQIIQPMMERKPNIRLHFTVTRLLYENIGSCLTKKNISKRWNIWQMFAKTFAIISLWPRHWLKNPRILRKCHHAAAKEEMITLIRD
jgi:hypothetical protein